MPIAVLYEHDEWFRPLFDELDRRRLPYVRIHAGQLRWNPAEPPPFSLLVNRMSPSAYLRGQGHAIHAVSAFLGYVESYGIPTMNRLDTYRLEISKAAQLDLFERLRVPYPAARVINHPSQARDAAAALRFPVVVKPNIGGSGARITRFDTIDALDTAVQDGTLDLGLDDTALVQEFIASADGAITRIELLEGEPLYAISITPPPGHGFNLCPADICQDEPALPIETAAGQPLVGFCPDKPSMQIEPADVEPEIMRMATAIARAAHLDVCGIEYLIDARDGRPYFYDVNALSNFVTDAERIIGFDPFERLADAIEARWSTAAVDAGARATRERVRV